MVSPDDDGDAPVESSLEELLAKKAADPVVDEDDGDVLDLDVLPEESSLDPLSVKAIPQQANEFTCRGCFLVKHRSQLADQARMVCLDCA